jgi:cellulose synthase/poly-beta-1,6-N-acetylglucosamine synthase-like glycosyltransferase
MSGFELIFFAITLLYALQSSLFIVGAFCARYKKNATYEPTVSIVVAARNEEDNIETCLSSLTHIEYPREKLEIIVADDDSTDATPAIIQKFTTAYPFIRSIVAQPSSSQLQGKANAIAQAIDVSKGEIILMTDADCTVKPTWVRSTVQYYRERTGIVAGLSLLRTRNWFEGMQSLDWALILSIAASAMVLKHPLSCIGNNFSFRRKAYDEVGGYRGIKFSVTEDFSLFNAITKTGRWEYRYPLESGTLVISTPCSSMAMLYRQKHRWGVGGKDMPAKGIALLIISFLMHTALFAFLFSPISWKYFIVLLGVKFLCDLILLSVPLLRSKYVSQIKYFLHFEVYYIVYTLLLPFVVFLGGKILWKGRSY